MTRTANAGIRCRLSIGVAAAAIAALTSPAFAQAPTAHDLDRVMPGQIKAGEFRWHPERSPSGPVVVVVSVPDQFLTVYRNGIRIAVATVSTGRPGHPTPTGVFTVLEKQEKHESSLYKGAQMPYMERLTWDGIALHAGALPGYPASHGCIRLPLEFSRLLYTVTSRGGTVVIAGKAHAAGSIAAGALLAPVVEDAGKPDGTAATAATAAMAAPGDRWTPEASPTGPVSILLSAADKRVYVYRNGVLIGEATVIIDGTEPFGDRVYTLLDGYSDEPDRWVPGRKARKWMTVNLAPGVVDTQDITGRIHLSPLFAHAVYDELQPGTTVYVTDAAATAETRTGPGFTVMASGESPARE